MYTTVLFAFWASAGIAKRNQSVHPCMYSLLHPSIYRVFLCRFTHTCIHSPIHPCIYSSIDLSIHVSPCSQLASGTESSWPKASRYHCIPYVMGGGWELFIRIRLVTAPATNVVTLPYLTLLTGAFSDIYIPSRSASARMLEC